MSSLRRVTLLILMVWVASSYPGSLSAQEKTAVARQSRALTAGESQLAREGKLFDLGTCVDGSSPGDTCATGICYGCESNGSQSVYKCGASLACEYAGEESCYGDSCPVSRPGVVQSSLAGDTSSFAETLTPLGDTGDTIDVIKAMNRSLASKGLVKKTRREAYKERVCYPFGEPGNLPSCSMETLYRDVEYQDALFVVAKDVEIVLAPQVEFGTPDNASVPIYETSTTWLTINCGPVKQTGSETVTATESVTSSVTNSRAVSTGKSIGAKVELKLPSVGGVGASSSVTKTVTVTKSETVADTQTVTRSRSVNLETPPMTGMRLRYGVQRGTGIVPYSATLIFDGPVDANNSGYKKISDLLKPEERTFKAAGHVMLQALSNINVRYDATPLSSDSEICRETGTDFKVIRGVSTSLPEKGG